MKERECGKVQAADRSITDWLLYLTLLTASHPTGTPGSISMRRGEGGKINEA
jgi:hypothetical protein